MSLKLFVDGDFDYMCGFLCAEKIILRSRIIFAYNTELGVYSGAVENFNEWGCGSMALLDGRGR